MAKQQPESSNGLAGAVLAFAAIAAGGVYVAHHEFSHHQETQPRKAGQAAIAAVNRAPVIRHNTIVLTSPVTYHETSTGQNVPSRIGNFRYYSQTDTRWAWSAYNTNGYKPYTIGLNGCAPTTGAMVISNLLGKAVNPVTVADYYMNHHFVLSDRIGGGTDGAAAIKSLAHSYHLQAYDIPASFSAIKEVIDDGGFVVLNGQDEADLTPATPGGHVIMVRGYTDDHELQIGDPDSIANTMSSFRPDLITAPAGYAIAVLRN